MQELIYQCISVFRLFFLPLFLPRFLSPGNVHRPEEELEIVRQSGGRGCSPHQEASKASSCSLYSFTIWRIRFRGLT